MIMTVDQRGTTRCLYTEDVDLDEIGAVTLRRGSHVEPADGGWSADLAPVGGPVLGPFRKRSEALAAEVDWIEAHVLGGTDGAES